MPEAYRQINVRVAPEIYRVLKAAAAVEGHRGMQSLLAPVIEERARALESNPAVKAVADVLANSSARRQTAPRTAGGRGRR
jgi:uncharacterized protein (DUF1778 family)